MQVKLEWVVGGILLVAVIVCVRLYDDWRARGKNRKSLLPLILVGLGCVVYLVLLVLGLWG